MSGGEGEGGEEGKVSERERCLQPVVCLVFTVTE